MASPLDLQEQEQIDNLKVFWARHGNLITWLLTAALLAYAGWNGWQWWQRDQGAKAGAIYDELDRATQAADAERVGRIFADLRERHPRTTYAQQGGLLAARVLSDKGKADEARAALAWVGANAVEDEYRTLARLRLAAQLMDAKKHDEALKELAAATAPTFAALVADRRGDVLLAQGRTADARAAYETAWKGMDAALGYRQLIEAKLTALGAPPAVVAAPAAGASK
ncbi:MAG: YfgM family protein [Aquabacterium sp.]